MKRNRAFMGNKRLRKNKKGGIEGLPLQLLIIIVIASLGLTMMVGWMNNIEEPSTIDRVDVSVNGSGTTKNITITAYDNEGNPIKDADVLITGLGVKSNNSNTSYVAGVTNSDGKASFYVTFPGLQNHGYFDFKVSKTGFDNTYNGSKLVTA